MNLNLLSTPTPAASEDRLLLSLIDLESIADSMMTGIAAAAINECVSNIRKRGYSNIQSGLGNKPALSHELPYIAFREIADRKFERFTGRAKTDVISSFKQSVNYGLETGNVLTDSNPSRAKSDDKKSSSRAVGTQKPFDAKKVADRLACNYNAKQIKAIIAELEILIIR
jgi:hypothetical protein